MNTLKIGDRVKFVSEPKPFGTIIANASEYVSRVQTWQRVDVLWDNGKIMTHFVVNLRPTAA